MSAQQKSQFKGKEAERQRVRRQKKKKVLIEDESEEVSTEDSEEEDKENSKKVSTTAIKQPAYIVRAKLPKSPSKYAHVVKYI